MRKVIGVGVVAIILFGLSAGGSIFLQSLKKDKAKQDGETPPPAEKVTKEADTSPKATSSNQDPVRGLLGRREFNPEADATVQQAARLRDQQEDLRQREEQFKRRLKNLDLIAQDIRSGREEMDKLRREVIEEKKGADEMLGSIERSLRQLEEKKRQTDADVAEQRKRITEVDTTRMGNIKRVGNVSDTMNAADAASILMQMADGGNLDTAALLLSNMKDRKAAEVLSQLPDKALAAQLLEKMIGLKQTNATVPPAARTNR